MAGVGISVFKTGALALIGDVSPLDARAHDVHEHGRGLLRRRRDRRPGDRRDVARGRAVVEVAVRDRGVDLRGARRHGSRALSGHGACENGGASFAPYAAQDARPARARLFGCWSCCTSPSRSRSTCGCPRTSRATRVGAVARGVRADDLLRAARRRPFPRRLVAAQAVVEHRAGGVCCASSLFRRRLFGGPEPAVYLLPLSGLFMSIIYPTLNSKGISCFPRSQHGAVAGVILFFTALAAAARSARDGRRERCARRHRVPASCSRRSSPSCWSRGSR